MIMRTSVYIDGFNLFFGALRKTPYRWLNLAQLCQLMLPKNRIDHIWYFTARVKPRVQDPQQPMRQQMYLRALATLPNLTVVYGHYLSHPVMMPLASSVSAKPKYVEVVKTEEKGSDVNLATQLLCDAFRKVFDVAVIVSNDSDLSEPIRIVKTELKKVVGVLNPHQHPSRELVKHATFVKQIRSGVLAASQFPDTLEGVHGVFRDPLKNVH